MKTLLLLIASLLIALPSLAQDSEIYGIARNSNPEFVIHLATVNTATGLVEDLSDTSHSELIANLSHTVDPSEQIFYYTSFDKFIGVDMNDGSLVSETSITTSQLPIFQNFIYNEMTEEIIGLERGGGLDNGQVYLAKIDPETGVVTSLSEESISSSITGAGYDIDLLNQWFHFFGEGKIFSIDVATGNIVHEPIVDTSEFLYFNNLRYNAADGNLYALGRNSNPAELFLVQIDPITGDVTTISPDSLGEYIELEGCAIDPFNEIYYFKRGLQTELVGIDINTGEEISATGFDFASSNGAHFGHFYFSGETMVLVFSNEEFNSEIDVDIFPNPTQNMLNVEGSFLSKIDLYSVTGKRLNTWNKINDERVQLDLSQYSQGIYFLKIFNEQNDFKTIKFVKK